MGQPRVLFKTKGGHKEGMGDVTSSLALAEEFRNQGYDVLFIINNNPNVKKLISKNSFKYSVADEFSELDRGISDQSFDIVVLSQLNTLEDEGLFFRRRSKMLVTIDDTGGTAKFADMRFNVLYPAEDSYSDFKYVALSPIFQKKHNIPKVIKEKIETILILQGGSDTYGYTPKIVRSLFNIPIDININVILGPNFSHYEELDEVLQKAQRYFNIIEGKDDLSDLMLQADLAISAGGFTLFELACLGVPTIVVCAELFEAETARRLQEKGFSLSLGFGEYVKENDIYNAVNRLFCDTNIRSKMSRQGKKLVDGRGTKRIVEMIVKSFVRVCND